MDIPAPAQRMRIYIGEGDRCGATPLFEVIVREARRSGLAGATVTRGIAGYGASSRVHRAKVLDLSADLPILVELVDTADRLTTFRDTVERLMNQAECGGLVTLESVEVLHSTPGTP
jgi:PII-like signaling protein